MVQRIFHPSHKRARWGMAVALVGLMLLSACGGGGGSTTPGTSEDISALALPDRIQLSNAQDENGAARAADFRALRGAARGAYNDTGTDYTNETKRSWVDDTDALDLINVVLGVCKDTGYQYFVNTGPYKALVRNTDESSQSQSGSSTTSTTTEQLEEIYVDVTRASNSDPMIVKIWLTVNGPGDQPMLIRGHFTVSQGVSAEYPYGVMVAHFKGTAADETEIMTMALSVNAEDGQVVIESVDDESEGAYESHCKVRVVANADVTQGNAYVSDQETDWDTGLLPEPTISQIAFNEDYFKATDDGGQPVVYGKDTLRHRIFRYKLFDAATGAAINRNSGFPIETADGKNGYVGYYGLWAPNNTTIAHGDTVTDMAGNAYSVFRVPGKLTKHTRSSMLLSELTGIDLSKWTDGQDTIVAWNGANFWKIGYRNQNNGQIVYYSSGDPAYHAVVTFSQWEGAWCESLKSYLRLGTLFVDQNGQPTTPTNDSEVSYHTEQTVDPNVAEDLTLYTWSFTLGLPIDQTVIDNAAAAEGAYWMSPATQKTFKFVASEMMLYDGTLVNPVTIPTDVDLSPAPNYQHGYHIGPLTTTQYDSSNHWQANGAEEYYTWRCGGGEWNQYTTIVDNEGVFASFDPPLSFAYTHSTANDVNGDSRFDGKKFRLEYDGFSLNMPWEFDADSGQWVPQINIVDGTALTGSLGEYVIKGIEEALIMRVLDDPSVAVFDNEEEVGIPTLEYDAAKTALVGDVPTGVVLKVIKGEVIE